MKVVVIGGTGLIGSNVVAKLNARGHVAVAASPASGVDTVTGEGVLDVLKGAEVVVDVSNSPSFADADVLEFFTKSTSNLLAAEDRRRRTPRRSIDRRCRTPTRQWLYRGEGRAGEPDQVLSRALLDRACHSILRVLQGYRRERHGRQRDPTLDGAGAADRRGRCRTLRSPKLQWRRHSRTRWRSVARKPSASISSSPVGSQLTTTHAR